MKNKVITILAACALTATTVASTPEPAPKAAKKTTESQYFGPEQEQAVADYVSSDDAIERNRIYNKHLREPLNNMVEYIIKRYKLHRKGMTFEESHHDALGDLIIKADKFNASRNTKAYSYYGTIIKRYLIGELIKDDKLVKRHESFDEISPQLEGSSEYTYEINVDLFDIELFIKTLIDGIKKEMVVSENDPKKKITENEIKLGNTLIAILDDKEVIMSAMGVGNKYNKIAMLETIRAHSGMSTKDIRLSMKRYKILYDMIKGQEVD